MQPLLKTMYPSMRMHEVCKLCRGTPQKVLQRFRCQLCRRCDQDYKDANLEREVHEWAYLRETWEKVRAFKQITTGIQKLDFVLESMFGKPHDRDWRNYSKVKKPVNTSPFVVLRLV